MLDKAPDAFRTISEVAEDLDLPQHVLRFWETRFAQIKPMKRGGGRRYYRPDDIDLLRGIRHLLYGEGYTIRGVQRILKDDGVKFVQVVWRSGAPQPARSAAEAADNSETANFGRRPFDHGLGEDGELERGQSLLGLLPSLLGDPEDIERIEPPMDDIGEAVHAGHATPVTATGRVEAPHVQVPPISSGPAAMPRPNPSPHREGAVVNGASPSAGLSCETASKLRAALVELGECRKILDAARIEED